MSKRDTTGIGQLAIRLKLLEEHHVHECLDELEQNGTALSKESLVRMLERKGYLTSYQGSKLLKGDTDGFLLGGFRILYRIASGSFGRVFRADDPRTGAIVAVKVLRHRWMEHPTKIEAFEREGKIGLTLKHPGIVEILAVNRDAATGQYFIVMEFVEGGNLRDLMRIRKKLDLTEALRVLDETASGLAYACSRGLTHRDIKLTNILMSSQGQAKLVDFGLADITGAGSTEDDGNVDRTVDYAGLEKATGVKQGDPRSDIYFLGCVFFELITGKPLLEPTRDNKARMLSRRFEVAPKVRAELADFPPQVLRLVERMTSLEPGGRYQSPAILAEAIRSVQVDLIGHTGELRLPSGPPTIFIAETSVKLQDVFRDKFRAMGYRVLISTDADKALQRYSAQPFHAIIVDAGTVHEDGIRAIDGVLSQADSMGLWCAAIVLLNEDQAELALLIPDRPNVGTLMRPMSMKQLKNKLIELLPAVETPNVDADEE